MVFKKNLQVKVLSYFQDVGRTKKPVKKYQQEVGFKLGS